MSGVAGDTFQVTFDGKSHAVACGEGFGSGIEHVESIDHYMRKQSRVSMEVRECFNHSAEFCREYGSMYDSAESLSSEAEQYLLDNHATVLRRASSSMLSAVRLNETRW